MKSTLTGLITVIFVWMHVPAQCAPELEFLQIIFAHKRYAPILGLIDSNDTDLPSTLTYEYFNTAPLSMPKSGMLNMYNLGVHFREVYDHFLGRIYTQKCMKMQTAEYPLSIISGQLVNAGLWPPSGDQKWDVDMNWQPIPTDYVTAERDTLLLGSHCPSLAIEKKRLLNTNNVREMLSPYAGLFERVSENTGTKVERPSDIAMLYSVLETRADLNQSLPHWAADIFPDGAMYNVSLLEYDLLWQTPLQKQLIGGTILKEVIGNVFNYIQGDIPEERKLMMYSGNEINIVGVLKALELWSPHIPDEGASIIFELHYDNETNTHGIKINYYMGTEDITVPLTISNCTEICPVARFLLPVFNLLPENAEKLCNWENIDLPNDEIDDTDGHSRSVSHEFQCTTLLIVLVIILCVK